MLSLVFVAVLCVVILLYYRHLWKAMQQEPTNQTKLFHFVDETDEQEDISEEHAGLLAEDDEEESEAIFYL